MIYYILVLLIVLAACFGVYRQWTGARALAAEVYAARTLQGELSSRVPEDVFTRAFMQTEAPHFNAHLVAGALINVLLIPPLISLFNLIWRAVWRMNGAPPVYEAGTLLHVFLVFLFVLAFMVALAAVLMWRYHREPRLPLRRTIERLNATYPAPSAVSV